MRARTVAVLALAGLLLSGGRAAAQAGHGAHQGHAAAAKNLAEVAAEAGTFTTLLAAVEAAGLADALRDDGPFTIFAPTDAAFAKLPAGALEALLADRARLSAVLTYHAVAGHVGAAQVAGMTEAETVQGAPLRFRSEGGAVKVNDATVVAADVQASNGVIHVIDTVLLPPG